MALTTQQWNTILNAESKVETLRLRVIELSELILKLKWSSDINNPMNTNVDFGEVAAVYIPLYDAAKANIQTALDDLV